MEQSKIKDFFDSIGADGDIGLFVTKTEAGRKEVTAGAQVAGYLVAKNWREVLDNLKQNGKVYIACGPDLPKPLYDLLCQYEDRGGAVQIMDKETMKFLTVQYDAGKARLAIVITEEDLVQVQKAFDVLSRVGLTERE